MKDETQTWLKYAQENLESAKILLQSNLYNPCLQNVQQTVEKALKAILVERTSKIKKTHDILDIKQLLLESNVEIDLSDDECDFLNSIYLPSKYPLGSILAEYEPDEKICQKGIAIAEKAIRDAEWILSQTDKLTIR